MSGGNDAWQIKSVFFKVHFAIAFRKTYLVETPVRIWSSIDEISSAWWLIVISFEEGNSQCALPDFSGTGLSILSLFWLGAIWQEGKTWIIFFERERDFCWLPHNSLSLPVAQLKWRALHCVTLTVTFGGCATELEITFAFGHDFLSSVFFYFLYCTAENNKMHRGCWSHWST